MEIGIIYTILTDTGDEFQDLFHWHCEGLGIGHGYIKKLHRIAMGKSSVLI